MRFTFLGTGTSQGIPVIGCTCKVCLSKDPKDKRLRTSALIETGGKNFVIDTGPDFRTQMLRENVNDLEAILFTHSHKDHTAGMDDVRAFNFINKKPVDVYANSDVQAVLKKDFDYVFANERYPGIPKVNLHTMTNKILSISGVEIMPILVYHYKLPVFGFRFNDLTYITDANYIPEEEMKKIRGTKILILNALRKEKHISHFTLDEAVELIQKINPEKAYLTHISHQMGLHEEINKELPDNIQLGYDGLKFEV